MTVAHHPAADGQSKRTNQTVEATLRCLIEDAPNGRPVSEWDEILPDMNLLCTRLLVQVPVILRSSHCAVFILAQRSIHCPHRLNTETLRSSYKIVGG